LGASYREAVSLEEADLFRFGGYSALAAIPAIILSGVFLALFFGGFGDFYGPLNDVFAALFLLLTILPAIAVYAIYRDQVGAWFGILTWLAVGGMLVAAIGQLILVVRIIDLQTSFVTGGVGITPVLVWLGALAYLVLRQGQLPTAIGWLLVGALAFALLLTLSSAARIGVGVWVFSLALLVAFCGWYWILGSELLRQA
jgi:hypothetical protein